MEFLNRKYSAHHVTSLYLYSLLRELIKYEGMYFSTIIEFIRGFCEHGNEPSGSIRNRFFFDKLSDMWLFK
jgi:hypothetical protein